MGLKQAATYGGRIGLGIIPHPSSKQLRHFGTSGGGGDSVPPLFLRLIHTTPVGNADYFPPLATYQFFNQTLS